MKKIKSLFLAFLLLFLTFTITVDADSNLSGGIDVEVKEWLGIAYPKINLNDQSISFKAELETLGDNATYHVNDTLIINIDSTIITKRTSVLPRSIFYTAFLKRSLTFKNILPLGSLFSRLFPMFNKFGSTNLLKGYIGENISDSIRLTVDYIIDEETFNSGEILTFTFYVMGFLPGDLNGLAEQMPIITSKAIKLEIDYFT